MASRYWPCRVKAYAAAKVGLDACLRELSLVEPVGGQQLIEVLPGCTE